MAAGTVLSISHLSKTFPGQRALIDFHLEVKPGEIHALVGENGSGKSTFIKCLSGYHTPDAGAKIVVDGVEVVVPFGPAAARKHGLAFIHQDLGLIQEMSIVENLAFGRGFTTGIGKRIKWRSELQSAHRMLAEFGHEDLDPDQIVGDLPLAIQTVIAVARVLHPGDRAKVIVLDEPTASMPHKESQLLFETVRQVAASGVGVVYVSHRLEEIFDLCDHVTALRDGKIVGNQPTSELSYESLVEMIVGKTVSDLVAPASATVKENTVLAFSGLSGGIVHDATGHIRAGEIVGVTGLLGSGGSDLGKMLFGAIQPDAGSISVGDLPVKLSKPKDAIKQRIAYVPSDRAKEAIMARQSMVDNVMVTDSRRFYKGWRQQGRELGYVRKLLSAFNVRPLEPSQEIYTLSGGNQQKVVLAKWMNLDPRVLILDEPVQGIDIGAKTEVYGILARAAERGSAVLIISTETEDLTRLCHRVLVMREGRIVAEVTGSDLTREHITALAYGDE